MEFNEVLSIIGILDFAWDLFWLFILILGFGGDSHHEVVSSRGSVLLVLVSGLDDELNWLKG
jgi:hypothetical protein